MTTDQILDLLDGVRQQRPHQWNARCPGHQDRHASLSVGVGQDGRVLLHCHAGCDLTDILAALGLSPGGLGDRTDVELVGRRLRFDGRRASCIAPPAPAGIDPLPSEDLIGEWCERIGEVASWIALTRGWTLEALCSLDVGWDGRRLTLPVRDRDGALVTVVRYRPGGAPKTLALAGRGRDLFPRPEEIGSELIWLLEGEPDAITARQLDTPAVAVPGVAKWDDTWPSRFKGRTVLVCFDCDAEGRAAARTRTGQLRAAGVDARVVDLEPAQTLGWDLSDAYIYALRHGKVAVMRKYLNDLERASA